MAINSLLTKTQLEREKVDWVIMGNVVSNLTTSNVARDAALAAGIPSRVPAFTVTLACVSANKAITGAIDLIQTGQADVVIAGGTESLSDIPIRYRKRFRQKLIESQKYRKPSDYLQFVQGLKFSDILPEIPSIAEFTTGRTMGQDCDRLAARIGVTREEQDKYAVRSHLMAAKATEEGLLKNEIAPVSIPPKFPLLDKDNGVRGDTSEEKMAGLKPAFVKPRGTLTAGNSSYLTDGAGAVLIMSEEAATSLGYKPKAAFRAYAYSAQDPGEELLLGPAYSTPLVLDKSKLTLKNIDVFEFHEAFAAQVVANLKCLDSDDFARENLGRDKRVGEVPVDKLNNWGGSLSIGHPFGATGARLVTTAANRLINEDGQFALVASCAAGAVGNAMILERYDK
jgi:acetyl-CoA acyltransferase